MFNFKLLCYFAPQCRRVFMETKRALHATHYKETPTETLQDQRNVALVDFKPATRVPVAMHAVVMGRVKKKK